MKTNRIRKLTIALLFGVLLTAFLSVTAFAADKYVTKTMTTNKAVTVVSEKYSSGTTTYTLYKLTVPVDKYLRLTITPVTKDYVSSSVSIFTRNSNIKSYRVATLYGESTKTWKDYVALASGTYYLSFDDVAKAKVELLAAPNKANYCRSKAIALESGKTVTIVQTPDTDYTRWYKITLTKAKKLKVTSNHIINLYIFDKNGAKINTDNYNSSTKSETSSTKLAKGTYYIRVNASNFYYSGNAYEKKGDYITMKWS